MFVSGHIAILADTLNKLKQYFDQKFVVRDSIDLETLKTGVMYPDLPCGEYKKYDTNKVFLSKKRICPEFDIIRLLFPSNNFDEIYQSHRGAFSYVHAMTNDPSLNVETIRNNIITKMMSYAILSIYDKNILKTELKPKPNIFWIGLMFHTITDSYSSAHTIRIHKRVIMPLTKKRDEMIKFFISLRKKQFPKLKPSITQAGLKKFLNQKYTGHERYLQFIDSYMISIYNSFKIYLFDKEIDAFVSKHYRFTPPKNVRSQKYDIANFQYVFDQPMLYHSLRDFLFAVKQYPGLYERMLNDCAYILWLFKYTVDHIGQEGIIDDYIHKVYTFLISKTFHISKKNLKNKTGVIYK